MVKDMQNMLARNDIGNKITFPARAVLLGKVDRNLKMLTVSNFYSIFKSNIFLNKYKYLMELFKWVT